MTIYGGRLATGDSYANDCGVIEIAGACNTTVFDGCDSAVTVAGFVLVDAGATLELIGTIDNDGGAIDIGNGNSCADLVISGTVDLEGSGAVALEGRGDVITGACGTCNTLDNASWIVGAGGKIGTGDNSLTLVNEACGVINADNASDCALVIDTGCNTIINHGLMEATVGGELDIRSDLNNASGVEHGAGGTIEANDGTVTFGEVCVENAYDILAQSCGTINFDGSHLDNGGVVEALGGTVTFCNGCVDNTSDIHASNGGAIDFNGSYIDNCGHIYTTSGCDTIDFNQSGIDDICRFVEPGLEFNHNGYLFAALRCFCQGSHDL